MLVEDLVESYGGTMSWAGRMRLEGPLYGVNGFQGCWGYSRRFLLLLRHLLLRRHVVDACKIVNVYSYAGPEISMRV